MGRENDELRAELAAMRQQLEQINRKTPKRFSWVRVFALLIVVLIILMVLAR
jgi:flagellar biosynthesis/type III secretory pathway M-ring protein FliF/YscJ